MSGELFGGCCEDAWPCCDNWKTALWLHQNDTCSGARLLARDSRRRYFIMNCSAASKNARAHDSSMLSQLISSLMLDNQRVFRSA
jgi:hypothetical protein